MGTRLKWTGIMLLLSLGIGCTPPGARAMLEGREHLNGNRPQQAAAAFEKATRLLPKDWRTWNHLGLALHRGGKHVDAGKAYQYAIKLVGQERMLG
ncbi:MAG: tetratricopeptide repeat protein, partial [Verrucomicrobiia bacterium]